MVEEFDVTCTHTWKIIVGVVPSTFNIDTGNQFIGNDLFFFLTMIAFVVVVAWRDWIDSFMRSFVHWLIHSFIYSIYPQSQKPNNSTKTSNTKHKIGGQGGWGYIGANGQKIYKTPNGTQYATSYGVGDTIGVQLDFDAKLIEFFKNGEALGVAFESLVAPVNAAVSVVGKSATISFIPETVLTSQVVCLIASKWWNLLCWCRMYQNVSFNLFIVIIYYWCLILALIDATGDRNYSIKTRSNSRSVAQTPGGFVVVIVVVVMIFLENANPITLRSSIHSHYLQIVCSFGGCSSWMVFVPFTGCGTAWTTTIPHAVSIKQWNRIIFESVFVGFVAVRPDHSYLMDDLNNWSWSSLLFCGDDGCVWWWWWFVIVKFATSIPWQVQ